VEESVTSVSGLPAFVAEIRGDADLPSDHAGAAVLPLKTCLRLIAQEAVGRLAFLSNGEIVVLPVAFTATGSSVCFRSTVGSKVAAAVDRESVTFEVDHYDQASRSGWSVLLTGIARPVTDEAFLDELEQRGLARWLDTAGGTYWIEIQPHTVTGRAVLPSSAAPPR
jgi:nitroimidazol reductase NimA-like FMN-containing flavoprotein (pyridoxamine 5'-phosphate oxidase superfamily)